MTGKTPKFAARSLGGMVLNPPLDQGQMGEILGFAIPDASWLKISNAYHIYGNGLDNLKASRRNHNEKDPDSWHGQQNRSSKELEKALDSIGWVMSREPFIFEASELYHLQNYGMSDCDEVSQLLKQAYQATRRALVMIERAKPDEIETEGQPQLRQSLARAIHEAITHQGIDLRLSDGRSLGEMPEGAAESDLTPFERLISACEIHVAETPDALARWVRRAVGRN